MQLLHVCVILLQQKLNKAITNDYPVKKQYEILAKIILNKSMY